MKVCRTLISEAARPVYHFCSGAQRPAATVGDRWAAAYEIFIGKIFIASSIGFVPAHHLTAESWIATDLALASCVDHSGEGRRDGRIAREAHITLGHHQPSWLRGLKEGVPRDINASGGKNRHGVWRRGSSDVAGDEHVAGHADGGPRHVRRGRRRNRVERPPDGTRRRADPTVAIRAGSRVRRPTERRDTGCAQGQYAAGAMRCGSDNRHGDGRRTALRVIFGTAGGRGDFLPPRTLPDEDTGPEEVVVPPSDRLPLACMPPQAPRR